VGKNIFADYMRNILPETKYEEIKKVYWAMFQVVFSTVKVPRGCKTPLCPCGPPRLFHNMDTFVVFGSGESKMA
jgi:hypothetical protein